MHKFITVNKCVKLGEVDRMLAKSQQRDMQADRSGGYKISMVRMTDYSLTKFRMYGSRFLRNRKVSLILRLGKLTMSKSTPYENRPANYGAAKTYRLIGTT